MDTPKPTPPINPSSSKRKRSSLAKKRDGSPAKDKPATNAAGPAIKDPAPTTAAFTFDPHGDLHLSIGSPYGLREMIVDSKTLCRLSSVFRKMLTESPADKKPDSGEWHVQLPADDPCAFTILMDIVHGLYERTPETLKLPTLYQVLVLTNKYDLARVLRPFAAKWLDVVVDQPSLKERKRLLFVAWELGAARLFSRTAWRLAEECTVDDEGELLDHARARLSNCTPLMVPCILDPIKERRKDMLKVISKECQAVFKRLLDPKAKHPWCQHSDKQQDKKDCRSLVLGKLVTKASQLSLLGMFTSDGMLSTYTGSVKSLMSGMEKMQDFASVTIDPSDKYVSLVKCEPLEQTMDVIRKQRAKLPELLTLWHRQHLVAQSAKTKIDPTA